MTRVAINGFGRIGRTFYRAAIENRGDFEIVAVNNPGWDEDTFNHFLKYDTVYGIFDGKLNAKIFGEKEPEKLPWKELNVDVVVESTGIFTDKKGAEKHLKAGAKKVIISAPAKDPDVTIVLGVNEEDYNPTKHKIISMASCTTNCLAPMVKVLQDEFGIEKGLMTTAHSYTADQNLQDGSHKDLRRARAAAQNIVPTKTGAAKAIFSVVEGLKDKMDGMALRVPTITVSITDLVCLLKKRTDVKEVNQKFQKYAGGQMKGILAVTEEPVVSSDLIKNTHSAILDAPLTRVIGGNLVKVVGWYDNEWGYFCRLVDLIEYIGSK
ncbi:MAG: type I glyceraldehyde-3-phosphate dehydrogenase [Candidatus Berkelbacteria bacterium]|nr:type I glyceraldehyde-3-phosphate dehydrogenase [Candidatus Berkelbacteria bacterium]